MTGPAGHGGPDGDTTRWVRADRAVFRRVSDGVIVLLLPDGEPEAITGSGGAVWDLLAEGRTLDELTTTLAARYDHDADIVRRDLEHTLDGLRSRHLVVSAP